MRVRRGLLFWGLFLIPLGGITLLVRAGVLDSSRLDEAWRLWPLVLIGIGLAIVLGRTRAAVVATAVIALALGTLSGAILAGGTAWIGAFSGCGQPVAATADHLVRDGTFDPGAAVRVELNCGSVSLSTTGQPGWRLDAAHRGPAPLVDSGPARLDVRVPSGSGDRRNDWTIALPAANVGSIDVTANAATATVDLAGSRLQRLAATMNAGDLRIALSGGAADRVDVTMNAGRIRLDAGPGPMTGRVSVNAGALDLCVPAGVGLQLDVTDQLTFVHNLAGRGLVHSGRTWTRAAATPGQLIALSIDGSAATLNLDPDGGCR